MEIKLRKLTTKSQALIVSSRLQHARHSITISRDENAVADSLIFDDNKVIYGWSAIFSYLNDLKIDSPLFADFYFICHHLKSGKGLLSEVALSKLESILSSRPNLSGNSLGDLDIITYSRLRRFVNTPGESLNQLPHLLNWFNATANLTEKSFVESTANLSESSTQSQKQPKKQQQQQQQQPQQKKPEKTEKPQTEVKENIEVAEKAEGAPAADAPKKQTKGERKAQMLAEKAVSKVAVEEAPKKVHAPKAPKGEPIDPEYQTQFDTQSIKRTNEGKQVLPVVGERNVLITSALPYVNNAPHLGTLIGCVLSADVFARYCRLRGYNTLYVCGTDEYGTATEMKALQEGLTPKEICDKYYKIQSDVYKWFEIDFDIFGRTTTEKHTKISQDIFLTLHKNGFIQEDTMNQSFCANCDKFLADRYVNGTCPFCKHDDCHGDQCDKCSKLINTAELIDAKCTICRHPSVIKETRHCFLDLPQLESEIEGFIDKQSKAGNWSDNAYRTSKGWIKTGLRNRCITRDLKWGTPVPLPGWEKKVMYVWFDAPIGYPSITANLIDDWEVWWKNPKNVNLYQFIGKDNIPFHCVIFPGTLLGTRQDWTFLHTMSSCEYLQYESTKFSKSKSVGVFGDDAQKTGIPVEVWRFYLLINRPEQNDANFQWADFQAKNNNELLPNIGNLVQRITKFIYSKFDKKVPALDLALLNEEDKIWLDSVWKLYQEYLVHMEKVEIKSALKVAMQISSEGNLYMQRNEPWNEANKASGRHIVSLFVLINTIRFVSAIFEPFLPSLSAKINFILGMNVRTPKDERILELISSHDNPISGLLQLVPEGQVLNNPLPIFRRLENAEIDSLRDRFAGKKL